MFIRKTKTRNKSTNETYFTHRLVASERAGTHVRQITLLNLGRHFDLPQADWTRLCARISAANTGQGGLLAETETIETLAQRYAARLIATRPTLARGADAPVPPATPPAAPSTSPAAAAPVFAEVDVASLELIRPRSVGVEAVGLAALGWLGIDPILRDLGFNGVQRAAAAASLIGRMAAPGSELSTWHWVRRRSALGELLDVDFEAMPLTRLYRVSDLLVRHRAKIEDALFGRIKDLFGLAATVMLYDLTNTYFEGTAAGIPCAARARSKEKRSDCPLVTLGLVLDSSGFVRRSKMFAGNVAEASTLAEMVTGLGAPKGALVIMDAGIATAANIVWLKAQGYRYLVVSRRARPPVRPRAGGRDEDGVTGNDQAATGGERGRGGSAAALPLRRTRGQGDGDHRTLRQAVRRRPRQTGGRPGQTARPEDAGHDSAARRKVEEEQPWDRPALRRHCGPR
jgi:hypothetical protein